MSPKEALTIAHHDFEKDMLKFSLSKLNNVAAAQDIVADTFIKTWIYLVKGGRIDAMKAFLYHVLNNLIIDQYRKKKSVSLDGLAENGFEAGFDDSPRLFDFIDGKAAVILIEKLPKKYKEVITLRYMKEYSIAEIAELTHQSKNTVAVRIHRGLQKLSTLYHPVHVGKDAY